MRFYFMFCCLGYLASNLPCEGVHKLFNAVVSEDRGVEEELCVGKVIPVNEEAVRHQGVPVVKVAELKGDTVPVLERGVEQESGIKL